MLLNNNSVFRHLPVEIGGRNLLILDSLRFTIEIIDRCWERLNINLVCLSMNKQTKDLPLLFSDAWSIVDNVQRFIKLYKLLPSDSQHKILDPLTRINEFRNTFAHLDERIDESFLNTKCTFYGAISWEFKNHQNNETIAFIAISGLQFSTSHEFTITDEFTLEKHIFNITLESANKKQEKINLNFDSLINDFT